MHRSAAAPRRRAPLALVSAAPFALAAALSAQPAPVRDVPLRSLIPRAVLFAPAVRLQPQLSPDGTRLAWIAPDEGVPRIWVRTLGGDDERVLASDDPQGVQRFVWQGDSRHVLHLQERDGSAWHLVQTDVTTDETRDLTPFPDVIAQIIGVSATHPGEMLVGLNRRDPARTDVYRLDLTTFALTLDAPNPGEVSGWYADDDLRVRAGRAVLDDGSIELRAFDGERWKAIRREGPDETAGGIMGFVPGGTDAWVISSSGANAARLLRVDLRRGRSEPVVADRRFNANDVLRHPATHALQAVLLIRDRREWELLDQSLRHDFERLRAASQGEIGIPSRDLADRRWIVSYEPADGPITYYLYDRAAGSVTPLFADRPVLERYTLAPMRVVSVPVPGAAPVTAYLTARDGARLLPTVIVAHDGPHSRFGYGWSAEAQWLADRGYAVVQVNYRGSSGYGREFRDAGRRDAMLTDLVAAKTWAVREGIAHPGKVCLLGAGYGGYLTLSALAYTPDDFSCGVAAFGETGIASYTAAQPSRRGVSPATYTATPRRASELAPLSSPIRRADRIGAPVLVLQGESDIEAWRAANDEVVEAMRRKGATVEYLVFPDDGRGSSRLDGNLDALGAAEAFLAKYIGGRAEPRAEATALLQLH